MSVWFRVDASQSIGIGHLMRCLALAQAMDDLGIEVVFAIRSETRSICLSRHDWVGKIKLIPDNISIFQEVEWLKNQESFHDANVVILDGYQFDIQYRKQLSQLKPKFILFDDTNDTGELFADVIINTADKASQLGYEHTAPEATLCLGPRYRVLRREFEVLVETEWKQRHSLSIVMGGSDVNNVTIKLLQALDTIHFCGPVRVLTGAAYPYLKELRDAIDCSQLSVQHLPNCQQVAEVFSSSRLVVSAAGSSQFELLACSTPAILLIVADNQVLATTSALKQGWCKVNDARLEMNVESLAEQVGELWNDEQVLHGMHTSAHDITKTSQENGRELMTAIFDGVC